MSALHLLARTTAVASCLACVGEEDVILLIEDGVYAAAMPDRLGEAAGVAIYALIEHLTARGLDPERVGRPVRLADFPRFVELAVAHECIVNWR